MAQELIGIREAARRLGVSDTSVHKAIKAGRVQIAGRTEKSGRPLVSWPEIQTDWHQNTDESMRTHVGSQGSPARRKDRKSDKPLVSTAQAATQDHPSTPMGAAPSLQQSRAVREAYMARLAKIEYEKAIGKLIESDTVKVQAFKVARQVRDGLMNIPDRVAAELAHETNPAQIHARLQREIRDVLASLATA